MPSELRFLQGVYPFQGQGLDLPSPFSPPLTYTVPDGKRAQIVYFRAGNPSDDLVYVLILRDGKPMRYFPVGARADVHIALAIVEELPSGAVVELRSAAPPTASGQLVLDVGIVEL